jgi:hypothetical protein
LLLVDCFYYPGVQEFVAAYCKKYPKAVVHLIFNEVLKTPGIYSYKDGNGRCEVLIKDGTLWIDNRPLGNDRHYYHKALPFDFGFTN